MNLREIDYITPQCCQKAIDTQVVKLGLYPNDNDLHDAISQKEHKPKWYIMGLKRFEFSKVLYDIKIEVEDCPFCHTAVPDIEVNKDFDKPVRDSDYDYCDTCGERLMCCECMPPEYRWKIKV